MNIHNLHIRKTNGATTAYQIATQLPEYFNAGGLKAIKEAVASHILYGAFYEDHMIGFITYHIINDRAIELSWLAVAPAYQNRGIGGELVLDTLPDFEKEFIICELKTLAPTHPDAGYRRTRNFWEKLGFIPLEIIDPYPGWGEGNPCQIYVKCL